MLQDTKIGISLKLLIIAILFFADDMAVIAPTRKKLNRLINIVRDYFKTHRLKLSEQKSKILSHDAATGQLVIEGDMNNEDISLDQVISFKYLGVPFNSSPHSFFKSFNEQVKQRALSYTYRVLSLVKSGPNRAELAYTLWNQVALPSILYGVEVFPINKGTIDEIDRCQAIIGKFILQVPRSTANVASYLDAGLRPIWSVIAEKVLMYARSTMEKPSTYWPRVAMDEHINLGDESSYSRYLLQWKEKADCYGLNKENIRKALKKAAMKDVLSMIPRCKTTLFAMSTPGSSPRNPWFNLKPWVSDSGISKIFAEFRCCNAGLGNRGPANNGRRYKLCPLCLKNGRLALNNEVNYHYILKLFHCDPIKPYAEFVLIKF